MASACRSGAVNIIEPYVTTREKGTGLGLAIVKKIVEEHGGELTFTSLPEGGTRVSLRFAMHPADLAPDPAEHPIPRMNTRKEHTEWPSTSS